MFNALANPSPNSWFWGPGFGDRPAPRSRGSSTTVEPSYYYTSDKERAVVEVEMPGVSKANISIEVHGHHLNISGKRYKNSQVWKLEAAKQNATENGDKKKDDKEELLCEYALDLRLGHDADIDAVNVDSCADGILILHIPSQTRHEPRKITIDH